MVGLNTLKSKHPQIYDNFEKDSFVNSITFGSQTLKTIFYNEIDKFADDTSFEYNASKVCHSYKKMGPAYTPIKGNEVGGTSLPLNIFIKDLIIEIQQFFLKNPTIGLATINDKNLRKHLIDAGQKKDFKGMRFFIKGYGIENVVLRRNYSSNSIMWSYINEKNREKIFDGMKPEEIETLPCILGLDPSTFSEVYICFGHLLPTELFKPTAMDAGMFPYWRLGGKTEPLASCSKFNGKTEIIHRPNTLKNLQNQIEIINRVK